METLDADADILDSLNTFSFGGPTVFFGSLLEEGCDKRRRRPS